MGGWATGGRGVCEGEQVVLVGWSRREDGPVAGDNCVHCGVGLESTS